MPRFATSRSPSNAPNHRRPPRPDEPALRRRPPPFEEETPVAPVLGGVAAADAGRLLPVVIARERPDPYAVRRLRCHRQRRRGEVHVDLDVPALGGPGPGVAAVVREGDRAMAGVGQLLREAGGPVLDLVGARGVRDEQEVAPPEGRVGLGAHDEVVAEVGDGRSLEAEQVEVGGQPGTVDAHPPILPPVAQRRTRAFDGGAGGRVSRRRRRRCRPRLPPTWPRRAPAWPRRASARSRSSRPRATWRR